MKKLLSLILALIILVSVFSACGADPAEPSDEKDAQTEETASEPASEPAATEPAAPAETTAPATPDEEPHYRKFDNPYQEAVCVYAEAMLARKTYVQYDDTRLIKGAEKVTYRWQNKTMAAEDYTKQLTGYTNCACFTYDCYYFALDYDIETWHTNALYYKHPERIMLSFEVDGNESQATKDEVKEKFLKTLQPGDIVVYHAQGDTYGHALLYGGDDTIIHSSAPGGGNYDYDKMQELSEPRGSIATFMTSDYFSESESAYLFKKARFAIVRPLVDYNKPIPEKTQNRVKNLQNVLVQKLCSHTVGQTVNPGEEMTYTIEIRNGNKWAMPLEVIDYVPENTTYVSGGDTQSGDKLTWSITVPKGETVTVEYKVRVKDDPSLIGKYVYTDKGSVGGVPVKCPKVYIAKTLSKEEQRKMTDVINANANSTLRGVELINKIYGDAVGKSVPFESEKALLDSCFREMSAGDNFELKTNSKYFDMIVPGMYGGYHVEMSDAFEGVRTRGAQTVHLIAGDLIVMSEDYYGNKTKAYMYTGENTLLSLDGEGLLDLLGSKDALLSTIGHYKYVIVRPSMMF
ncbi:MAG: DUF11 domain-containing protein [Clostridia bacterium]|nr:DUF11 domain-containing protein [Clostridia bacterium]